MVETKWTQRFETEFGKMGKKSHNSSTCRVTPILCERLKGKIPRKNNDVIDDVIDVIDDAPDLL